MITKGKWKVSGSVMEYKDAGGKKYTNRLITHGLTWADTDDTDKVEKHPLIAEVYGHGISVEERDANAQAISAVPDLIEEHRAWSVLFADALLLYLQGDVSKIDEISKYMKICSGKKGVYLESKALQKAGEEVEG